MSASHYFEGCRALYQNARKRGSPVVNVIELGSDDVCAETADGKVLYEAVAIDCCKWAVKFDVAQEWLDKYKPEGEPK